MPVKDPDNIKRKTKKDKLKNRINRNGTHQTKHIRIKYDHHSKKQKHNI